MFFPFTVEEFAQVRTSYFEPRDELKLIDIPAKQKRKYIVFVWIQRLFEPGKIYTENEINAILENVYFDYVSLRRSLIDYRLIERKNDGSSYWVGERIEPLHS